MNPLRKVARLELHVALLVVGLLVAACAGPSPRSLEDTIAYGYSTVASARLVNASLIDAGAITVDEARRNRTTADRARAGLDAAQAALEAGNRGGAAAQLELIREALGQLEAVANRRRE